ncbi:hypothetical protein EDM22_04970 [Agromyces tardus]|uniref:Uncharacterized protein n=1 Tax=Agromyces tardus TaxID=2583849 RepID=A0A3M8AIT1_9MICO|nr:hypothetical protein EDM22_04970 [Agromyces tardus]
MLSARPLLGGTLQRGPLLGGTLQGGPLLGGALLLLRHPLLLGDALLLGAPLREPLLGRASLGLALLRDPFLLGDAFLLGTLRGEPLRGLFSDGTLLCGRLLGRTLRSLTFLGRTLRSLTFLGRPLGSRPLRSRPLLGYTRLLRDALLLGGRQCLLGNGPGQLRLLLGDERLRDALPGEPRLVVGLGRTQHPGLRTAALVGPGVAGTSAGAPVTARRHRRDHARPRDGRLRRRQPREERVEPVGLPGNGEGRVGVDSMVDRLGPVGVTLANLPARQGSFGPQRSLCAWRGTVGHEGGLEHVLGAFGVGVRRVAER